MRGDAGAPELQSARNLREKGEFQLTSALEELRKRDGFLATLMNGRRFDIGTPEAYVETVAAYCREGTEYSIL